MQGGLHETAHDLLAPSGGDPVEARLERATSRADFLASMSRSVTASMQTDRAIDRALQLIVDELVDWAQVMLTDRVQLTCRAKLTGHAVQSAQVPHASGLHSVLERVIGHGQPELFMIPPGPDAVDAMHSAVPAERLRESLQSIRPLDLLVVPLTARGRTFGTMTLARRAGQGFDAESVTFLDNLAHALAATLDTTRMIADSRRVASVITRDLAPPKLPQMPGARLGSFYRVAFQHEAVGGDFYDLHGEQDDWTLVVGDVCGKGVDAAVLTGKVRQSIRTAALVDRSPGAVLGLANRALVAEGQDTFITAVCARVRREGENLRVDIAAAGHPEPYLIGADGRVERVDVRGTVLGVFEGNAYDDTTVLLGPGDSCLFYTDGVLEAPGHSDRFGEERLRRVLEQAPRSDVNAVVEMVSVAISGHLGDRPHDDIAIVGVQNDPAQS